jgi:hypothetical protein
MTRNMLGKTAAHESHNWQELAIVVSASAIEQVALANRACQPNFIEPFQVGGELIGG